MPRPVTHPIRALTSWITAINGKPGQMAGLPLNELTECKDQ